MHTLSSTPDPPSTPDGDQHRTEAAAESATDLGPTADCGGEHVVDVHELDWWRRPCAVTDTILLSGDLPADERAALRQLEVWVRSGVGIILDCRGEHSDEHLVARHAPEVTYLHVGTHDAGGAQDPDWFTTTVRRLRAARSTPRAADAKVMIHCHMGVNRAPSMALAVLLDQGWDPVDALDAILRARPIAAVAYAESAIRWHHGRVGSTPSVLAADLERVDEWFLRNDVDAARSIGRIRRSG